MKPPYTLSPEIVALCSEIGRLVGRYEGLNLPKPAPQLRRTNRIRSIQSSLAIEGNKLTADQVSDVLDGKRVVGPARDILEVRNAIAVYDRLKEFDPCSENSFRQAHRRLMEGLVPDAGRWRSSGIGVFQGNRVIHMAPKAALVPKLMQDLFHYLKTGQRESILIASAVLHYEIEFIHPFSDGNGRMGRLWQEVLLVQAYPFFEFIPVESVIRNHQKQYYEALRQSDQSGDSRPFIEFCLRSIRESLKGFLDELRPEPLTTGSRLELARNHFRDGVFSRKDYLLFFKTVSTATASRDLSFGTENKLLKRTGDKALARYNFYKKPTVD